MLPGKAQRGGGIFPRPHSKGGENQNGRHRQRMKEWADSPGRSIIDKWLLLQQEGTWVGNPVREKEKGARVDMKRVIGTERAKRKGRSRGKSHPREGCETASNGRQGWGAVQGLQEGVSRRLWGLP